MMESIPEKGTLNRRLIFFMVSTGVFMSTMDSSMVNVALPTLMRTFQTSLALTEWVVLVYLLTVTMLLIFWGKLSSRLGSGRIYAQGMLLFTVGSFLCGMAPGMWWLILCRFIQALGASMMMATGPALIKMIFPPEKLGRGLGLIGVATSLGLMTGPAISGLILRWAQWRILFWITVPVGLVVYIFGRRLLISCSASESGKSHHSGKERVFDFPGAVLWAIMVFFTLLMATHATALCCANGFASSSLFIIGNILLFFGWLLLVRVELKSREPFLPVRLLRQRFFLMAVLSSGLSFAVLFFVLILMPFYLDQVRGLQPDQIGFLMMSVPLCVFIVSPLAGRMHDRVGARIVATAGLVCCMLSLFLLTGLTPETSPFAIGLRLALLGFGQAMFLSPNSASALGGVADRQAGITASMLATARNFGMLAGTALAGLSFSIQFSAATGGLDMREFIPVEIPAFMTSLTGSFEVAMVLAAMAITASVVRGTGRKVEL